jgi:putative endonuclease
MNYVYVLVSKKDGESYIGSTTDLRRRLAEHNDGKSKATAPRRPFILAYYEAYLDEDEARTRDQVLKRRGQARYQLLRRISESLRQAQN